MCAHIYTQTPGTEADLRLHFVYTHIHTHTLLDPSMHTHTRAHMHTTGQYIKSTNWAFRCHHQSSMWRVRVPCNYESSGHVFQNRPDVYGRERETRREREELNIGRVIREMSFAYFAHHTKRSNQISRKEDCLFAYCCIMFSYSCIQSETTNPQKWRLEASRKHPFICQSTLLPWFPGRMHTHTHKHTHTNY